MINLDPNNQEAVVKFVLDNLAQHTLMALGTLDDSGEPWVICAHFWLDGNLDIIWQSRIDTEHSQHLAKNPVASLCIFSRTEEVGDFGFYTKARVREITDPKELETILRIRQERYGKESAPERFLKGSPDRIYAAEIQEAWVNHTKVKIPLDLNILRKAYRSR